MLERDDLLGLTTYHEYDDQTDETRIIYVGDDMPVVEENKRLKNDPYYSKRGIKQEFWKYASVPAGIQVKWLIEHGVDFYNPEHGHRNRRSARKNHDPAVAARSRPVTHQGRT